MARASELLLLIALIVIAVEARRNTSDPIDDHLQPSPCGDRLSSFSQQQQQPEKARENWEDFMSEIYGENWDDEESSRHLDAARCTQWAVYGKGYVAKDKKQPKASDEDLGEDGCLSALIREAIMGSLEKETFEWEAKVKKYSVLQLDRATDNSNQKKDIEIEVRTWEPQLCKAIAVKSKKACQVRVYAAHEFAQLRKSTAMPNRKGPVDFTDKIAKSIDSGPLVSFKPGAGKSPGAAFSSTSDNIFKIKIGIRHDTTMNEAKHMLRILVGTDKGPSLLRHLQDNTNSLLNRYLSMIRVRVLGKEKYVMLMADATYGEDARIQKLKNGGSRLVYTRYDLKGPSREEDEQQKVEKQHTLLNGDFKERENNYLDLTKDQCRSLRQAVHRDTAFLDEHSHIDYSLFVGVTRGQSGGCRATPGEPFCIEATESLTYTFCIIDYVNYYNFAKGFENFWHGGKFENYGSGINKFLDRICPGRLDWYETSKFRMWCAIVIFFLVVGAGGAGFWYWRMLQGSRAAPAKQPGQQVPWQQGAAPPMPQPTGGDDFGIATGQPQGYVRQHGMGGMPPTGQGFA